jgi:hypothetical protein
MVGDRSEHALRRGGLVFEVRNGLSLTLISDDASSEIVLPYPHAGYGGHKLVISPDESHLALYLFSGQSEQGWELFSLVPTLRHLGCLPYVDGEGDPPRFSSNGRWLAMFVSVTARVRDTDTYFEEVSDPYADDSVVIEWAQLYVQRVPDGEIARHAVGVLAPRALDFEDVGAWATYGAMRFATDEMLELTMPWGERITCTLPVTSVPVSSYPHR